MDEDFVCPMVWKWSDIYTALHSAWEARADEGIPEPPHMLAPNSTDGARQQRWQETVEWAEAHGFTIPTLDEHEKYYRV